MLKFTSLTQQTAKPYASLTLSYHERIKSRQKVTLDNGEEAGLFLPRGTVLKEGDHVRSDCERIVQVIAAEETVSVVTAHDTVLLIKAAYHLGNRHVQVQVDDDALFYLPDPVLDDMLRQLGFTITLQRVKFHPESGAYHH